MALPFAAALPAILAALEKWTEWRRIREAPSRIDRIEKELADLTARIAAPPTAASAPAMLSNASANLAPGRACPACGALAMRRTKVVKDEARSDVPNAKLETWHCKACGEYDEVERP